MPTKYVKKAMPHIRLLTNITLVLGTILVIAFGAFAIRMQQGPMDLNFAREKLEKALSDNEEGYSVNIGSINLVWPQIIGPVLLDMKDVRIVEDNVTTLSVENVGLGLSGLNLLIGQIMPSVIILDGPSFHLVQKDGRYNFFWQRKNEAPKKEEAEASPRDMRQTMKEFLNDIAGSGSKVSNLAALKRVEIRDAVITTTTEGEEKPRYLALANLDLKKSFSGVQGNLDIMLPGEEGEKSYFKSEVIYRKSQKDLTLTADIRDINPSRYAYLLPPEHFLRNQDVTLNGDAQIALDENLKFQFANIDFNIPEGKINLPDFYDKPVPIKDLMFTGYLNRPEEVLEIRQFNGEVGGIPLEISALGTIQKGRISAPLMLKISEASMEEVAPMIPKSERESSAGEWLTEKLKDGKVMDVVLTADFLMTRDAETRRRNINLTNTRLAFNAEDMTIQYSDTLMPVKDVTAKGLYENDTLTVTGTHGKIGDIVSKNVVVKMTDLSVEGGGYADIEIKGMNGNLKTALLYASDEPIALKDDLGFDVNKVEGKINADVTLGFPTLEDLPKEEVKVKIKGTVNDILLPDVVQGLPLSGGPYDLSFNEGLISLKGSGQLSERPITVEWQQYLDSTGKDYESKIIAKVTADDGLRKAFGIGLEDYISGPLPVDVTYIDKGVKATIDVKGDLTPTTLHISPFDYLKQPGTAGTLSLKAIMNNDDLEEVDNLKVEAGGLVFSGGRIIFKTDKNGSTDIARGSIPKFNIGKTEASAEFEATKDNTLKIVAKGPVIDLAPFINNDKPQPSGWEKPEDNEPDQPLIISVTGDKMLAHEGETLSNTQIYLETNTTGDITRLEMDAKLGEGSMYLRFKPEEVSGKRTFRMESTDAGYTLKAFGLYDKVRGGKLTIYGQPARGDLKGDLYGQARMDDFRVKGAPALAKLLGAMSLNGVQDLLRNEGVFFQRLESDFEWQFHDDGNFLVVRQGRTSGSSLGLTFEGNVDQGQGTMDLSGTIVPMSGINNMVGNIPVIGQILTGGDALIAATYKIAGPTEDPKVSVNPLSVLAPGFLRKILFEGDPKDAPQR